MTVTVAMLEMGQRLLAAAIMATTPPPTNDQTSNDKEKRRGAKLLTALVHVKPDGHGAPRCFQPIIT